MLKNLLAALTIATTPIQEADSTRMHAESIAETAKELVIADREYLPEIGPDAYQDCWDFTVHAETFQTNVLYCESYARIDGVSSGLSLIGRGLGLLVVMNDGNLMEIMDPDVKGKNASCIVRGSDGPNLPLGNPGCDNAHALAASKLYHFLNNNSSGR